MLRQRQGRFPGIEGPERLGRGSPIADIGFAAEGKRGGPGASPRREIAHLCPGICCIVILPKVGQEGTGIAESHIGLAIDCKGCSVRPGSPRKIIFLSPNARRGVKHKDVVRRIIAKRGAAIGRTRAIIRLAVYDKHCGIVLVPIVADIGQLRPGIGCRVVAVEIELAGIGQTKACVAVITDAKSNQVLAVATGVVGFLGPGIGGRVKFVHVVVDDARVRTIVTATQNVPLVAYGKTTRTPALSGRETRLLVPGIGSGIVFVGSVVS